MSTADHIVAPRPADSATTLRLFTKAVVEALPRSIEGGLQGSVAAASVASLSITSNKTSKFKWAKSTVAAVFAPTGRRLTQTATTVSGRFIFDGDASYYASFAFKTSNAAASQSSATSVLIDVMYLNQPWLVYKVGCLCG